MESTTALVYSQTFDEQFRYDGGDLGACCTPERTVFKLWSPQAERVELSLYKDGAAPAYDALPLRPGDRGVWSLELEGDLHGTYYDYTVTVGGVSRTTADPYAAACGCNAEHGHRPDPRRAGGV